MFFHSSRPSLVVAVTVVRALPKINIMRGKDFNYGNKEMVNIGFNSETF